MPLSREERPLKAPLWAVLAITFILSIGTGAVTQGLYFIAVASCGFSRSHSFLLGVVLGASYIPGALAAGPILRRVDRPGSRLTPRAVLMAVVLGAGVVSLVPPVLVELGRDPCAAVWLVAVVYGSTTGFMWPLVEWYLTGGRKQGPLRTATGRFNITWTVAVAVAFWMLAPFLADGGPDADPQRATAALYVVAGLHLLAVFFILPLPATPAKHLDIQHDPHPPIYETLLAVSRRLLPTSYLLMCVLGPAFPIALTTMGVSPAWQPILVSVWLLSRVATMFTLERWHGWHGKPVPLAVGAAALFLGFTLTVTAPAIGSLPLLVASLGVFGVGMGTIYTSALYYVFEIDDHGANAGGSHEALIGIGYTMGPFIGLAASLAVDGELIAESAFPVALIAVTLVLTVMGLGLSWRRPRLAK